MTTLSPHTLAGADLRAAAADPDVRRRAAAYGIAGIMHAAALWALIVLPPAILPQMERAAAAISVRLYTVAGGADAESDAPLFEPPLAGGRSGDEASQAGAGADAGEADGSGDAASARTEAPRRETEPAPADDPAGDPVEAPEPAPDPALEAAEPIPEPTLSPSAPAQPGDAVSPAQPSAGASTSQPRPSPPPAAARDPGAPVATTQPPAEAGPAQTRAPGPPSFADILARARSRLDPADYRLLVNFGDGVQATITDSFCLSSVEANREAFGCPPGANPDAARLAQYGLQGLGEEAPEFLEDMDRLAYQLATLGADDNAITRILTHLRESRREVIEAGPLRRQMGRDRRHARTDNLGNPVDGPPMPGNPGGN